MRIIALQHIEFETPALIRDWALDRGHDFAVRRSYCDDISEIVTDDFDMLVIMGGPMGVHDEDKYSWLSAEKTVIRQALERGKYVLGVCLGAQLIAASLGAKVVPHEHREIGWFPVTITDKAAGHLILAGIDDAVTVFHWHGDRFEIPEGALHLFSSAACDNQAFLYNRFTLGLQFHLEMTSQDIEAMLVHCADALIPSASVQSADVIRNGSNHLQGAKRTLYRLLDNWLNLW